MSIYSHTIARFMSKTLYYRSNISYFSTHAVPPQPRNVTATRIDSTTMMVSWEKLTLVELKGLANYTITYGVMTQSRKRQAEQGTVMVPWTSNNVTITNLRPAVPYDVSVGTVTTGGTSREWCLPTRR